MRASVFSSVIIAMVMAGAQCASAGTINYQLNFTGSGGSTTVSSIEVLNLTQNTTTSLGGNDVLILSRLKNGQKNAQNIVQMQYGEGERLLIKGISGNFSRVITIVPTQNQTVNFLFVACTDAENNHYPVVTIGTQTWMAENLKYLPSVGGKGSATIPCYWVTGYSGTSVTDAKATSNYATMGVLYNWAAAEQAPPPKGWHLPTKAEWTTLQQYLVANGFNYDGNTEKKGDHPNTPDMNGLGQALASSRGWKKWTDEDAVMYASKHPGYSKAGAVGSTDYPEKRNATGFSALPTGNAGGMSGAKSAYWWCAADAKGGLWYMGMQNYMRAVYANNGGAFRANGFAIRCLRDVETAPAAPAAAATPAGASAATNEIIIDDRDPGLKSEGDWKLGEGGADFKGGTLWAKGTSAGNAASTATWTPDIKIAGMYDVYEWHGDDNYSDHASNAPFTVKSDDDTKTILVDLQTNMGKWNLLGTFKFAAGKGGNVSVSSKADGNVLADAVKFVPHQ